MAYYDYNPSLVATAIFAALFGTTTLLHISQMVRSKAWYFVPFVIGGLFESIGYAVRAISVNQRPDYERGAYIIQTILILLAPALYAASIYMVLGRIIMLVNGEHLSLIRRKWLTKIFVTGDVISFLVQVVGGGIQASGDTPKQEENGRAIVIGGLFIQTIVFSMFLVVTGLFHCRIVRRPTGRSEILQVPWLQYINVLYVVSVLIMVRSIFRVAEYIQGRDGELMTREFYFYILDTALMFIMSAIFNYFHPTSIIPQRRKDDLELDSMERLDSRTGTGIQET